jgi:hypothetical protein
MYHVFNVSGGTICRTRDLRSACAAAARDHFSDGYVRNKQGARPVIDADDGYMIGEYDETWDDLHARSQSLIDEEH